MLIYLCYHAVFNISHFTDPVKMTEIRCAEVEEKWGVKPDKLGDVLALAGDSSDNIPGE